MNGREEVPCLSCGEERSEHPVVSRAQLARSREPFTFVRCVSCGLVRLSPRPVPAELGRWYEDYLLHGDARAWGRFAPFVARSFAAQDRARVRAALRCGPLDADSRVLDVGCGRPSFLAALAARTSARCTGIDLSDAGWRDDRGAFAGLSLQAAPLADARLEGAFDLVTAWHALEHDPEPLEALRRLRAVTRPSGALVVEVPDEGGLTRRLQGGDWAGFHTPRHMAAFRPDTLTALLERTGWRVERLQRWGTLDPYVLWWLGRVGHDPALSDGLESRFVSFVAGKIATWPLVALQRLVPLGVMTAVARPA